MSGWWMSSNVVIGEDDKLPQARLSIVFLVCALLLSFLTLYSMEWVRLRIMDYCLSKSNYEKAEEIGAKIVRKRALKGPLGRKFIETTGAKYANALRLLIEKERARARKEWNSSRLFFTIDRTTLEGLALRCQRFQALLQSTPLAELNGWGNCNKLDSSPVPYSVETGYLENDVTQESGVISFGTKGGFALDYNFRSIGVDLGSKKPVAAIRLRHYADETRVKPENLSLWISDDNKLFRRYTEKIVFSREAHAILLDNLDFSSRYFKIHCDFKDDRYTFAEDFKNILEVYGPPDFERRQNI